MQSWLRMTGVVAVVAGCAGIPAGRSRAMRFDGATPPQSARLQAREFSESRAGLLVVAGMVAATAVVSYFTITEPDRHPPPPRDYGCDCYCC